MICVTLTLALELPPEWEPMQQEEVFKRVQLQPNSAEYDNVAKGFLKTARYNIQKVSNTQKSKDFEALKTYIT